MQAVQILQNSMFLIAFHRNVTQLTQNFNLEWSLTLPGLQLLTASGQVGGQQ